MSETNQKTSFVPFIGFNDPIFIKIDNKVRFLLDKKPTDLNRELQIRTMLYTNFNNYLSLILVKNDFDQAIKITGNIESIPESDRLKLIASTIKVSSEKIIENFVKLFNQTN